MARKFGTQGGLLRWAPIAAGAAGLRTVAVTNTYSKEDLATADLIVPSLSDLHLDVLRTLCA